MSLLKSIAEIWKNTGALTKLVAFDRVFTGRIPQTEQYHFPYVSILLTGGRMVHRSSQARYSQQPLSFHIWVDDAALATGEAIEQAIADAYADRCWFVDDFTRVFDVLDEGPGIRHQTDLPSVKAWEIVKLFALCVECKRVDRTNECCILAAESSASSSGSQG
jgi:hypothetical protein